MSATETDKDHERRFWQLALDDKRMLYITFVGGLAANIGLVLVVGLGLLMVRIMQRSHTGFVALVDVASTVGVFALTSASAGVLLGRKHRLSRVFWAFVCVAALAFAVIGVALVGYAAGIK